VKLAGEGDMRPPAIRFEGVAKSFGAIAAVAGLDLDIAEGEFFSLLGPSGCGKSTLLRMLAGLETPCAGRILIGGQDVTAVPPYARPVNMMFQSYALFPHMSVADNVAFGLRQDGRAKADIKRQVAAMLDLVQLGGFGDRRPHQLSGGQRQRVALARCLAKQPKVVLLDEPLAALDKKLRQKTQFELVRIQRQVGITFVMVTHDQDEAMTMSTRVAVMNAGKILQVDRPHAVYEYPADRFVAEFIGSANLFDGVAADGGICVEGVDAPLLVSGSPESGANVTVMIRPEKIAMSREAPVVAPLNVLCGEVADIAYHGDVSLYQVRLPSGRPVVVTAANLRHTADPIVSPGDHVFLSWHPGNAVVLGG
jgi:putrescine transport system ATP-binding protein